MGKYCSFKRITHSEKAFAGLNMQRINVEMFLHIIRASNIEYSAYSYYTAIVNYKK